ncbi:hypothetical protein S83_008162, partial [Arachis hypogaea]
SLRLRHAGEGIYLPKNARRRSKSLQKPITLGFSEKLNAQTKRLRAESLLAPRLMRGNVIVAHWLPAAPLFDK